MESIDAMDEVDAVVALAALAQPARLRVFRALVGAAPDGLTPGELAATLGLAPSTLSFHLKELAHAGLVDVERDSRHLVYRAALARMNALLGFLTDHCCQARPAARAARGGASSDCCAPARAATATRPDAPAVVTPAPSKASSETGRTLPVRSTRPAPRRSTP